MPVYTTSDETIKIEEDVKFEEDLLTEIFSFEAIRKQLAEECKLKQEEKHYES